MLSTIQNATLAARITFYSKETNKAMDRISSGSKLNASYENPAAFSVAEIYRSQVNAARSVTNSMQDALNIVRIGENGVRSIVEVVQTMRDVVMQAANGTNTEENLAFYQTQLNETRGVLYQAFVTAQQFRVSFEGNNTQDRILNFMVGTNPGDTLAVDYNPLRDTMRDLVLGAFGYRELYDNPNTQVFLGSFGIYPAPAPDDPVPPPLLKPGTPPGSTWAQMFPNQLTINPATPSNVQSAFGLLDKAQSGLLTAETYLGTISQRLELHLSVVQKFETSVAASESALRDADLAQESTNLTKAQVMQQASQAMLVQANARIAQVLELIRQG